MIQEIHGEDRCLDVSHCKTPLEGASEGQVEVDPDCTIRRNSCPISREQLVLALLRRSLHFAARVDADVCAGVHQVRDARVSIQNKNAAGDQTVVVCRLYVRPVPFPDFHVYGELQFLARSPYVA